MAAIDLIKKMAKNILTDELKGLIKGTARGDDAQVLVKHQKRIANRINDSVRERNSIFNSVEWRVTRHINERRVVRHS